MRGEIRDGPPVARRRHAVPLHSHVSPRTLPVPSDPQQKAPASRSRSIGAWHVDHFRNRVRGRCILAAACALV